MVAAHGGQFPRRLSRHAHDNCHGPGVSRGSWPSRAAAGGMDRKAEEEPIAELWATTTTPRGALRRLCGKHRCSRLKIHETRPTPGGRGRLMLEDAMAGMKITLDAAMRATDVARPRPDHRAAAQA